MGFINHLTFLSRDKLVNLRAEELNSKHLRLASAINLVHLELLAESY